METSKEKKKKKGFLSFLMYLFIIFVLLVLISVGLFYWKKKTVTVYALNMYSTHLSNTITSEKYYQINDDQEYKIEYEGKDGEANFDKMEVKQQILKRRKDEVLTALQKLVDSYSKNENKNEEWINIFSNLRKEINQIFSDNKVETKEYQLFLAKLEGYSK